MFWCFCVLYYSLFTSFCSLFSLLLSFISVCFYAGLACMKISCVWSCGNKHLNYLQVIVLYLFFYVLFLYVAMQSENLLLS